jgi:type IV pilus assembly protein PilF
MEHAKGLVRAGKNLRYLSWVLVILLLAACSSGPAKPEKKLTEREQLNLQLGIRYMQQGDFNAAVEKLHKVLETRPDLVVANSMLGLVYGELDELERAESHFKQALKSAKTKRREYADVQNNYGIFLCRHGDYEKAQDAFAVVYEHKRAVLPERAYENAGLCAVNAEKYAEAETYFRKALEIRETMPRSLLGMAKVQLNLAKPFIARAYIQRFEQTRAAATAESLWLGYTIEKQLNAMDEAGQYKAKLLVSFPDSKFAMKLK